MHFSEHNPFHLGNELDMVKSFFMFLTDKQFYKSIFEGRVINSLKFNLPRIFWLDQNKYLSRIFKVI